MKYKVGDKVLVKDLDWYNKNKDNKDEVLFSSLGPVFTRSHSKYAGRVMTIDVVSKLGFYILKEDKEGNTWYDEMFDGLAEDGLLDEYEELTDRAFKGGYEKCKSDIELNGFQLPEGYIFKDDKGNEIFTSKIILEKKKKGYPDTYEECLSVLGIYNVFSDVEIYNAKPSECELFEAFIRLKRCRDAYWQIAGEELGLEGPWEPDHRGTFEHGTPIKYVIYNIGTHIVKERKSSPNHILSFPTEEMAYAFYEAFQKEIEICKKLL